MPEVLFDAVSPAEWFARVDYDAKNWTPWNPDKYVLHYGGGWNRAGYAPFSVEKEMRVLRGWEDFHLSKGWLGLAYNYAIGQTGILYRIRGEQRSGATSGDEDQDGIPENHEARAVVFILGGHQKPSSDALATFQEFYAGDPMRVIGHRDSTVTPCPGDYLYEWIQQRGFEQEDVMTPEQEAKLDAALERLEQLPVAVWGSRPGGEDEPSPWQVLTRNRSLLIGLSAAGGAGAAAVVDLIASRLAG